jgi:hypothetical protein
MAQTTIPTLDNAAETYEEITNTLKRSFFRPPLPAIMQELEYAKYPPAVHYNASITIEQIQRAVHKVAPDKAPGPDEITNRVLKQALPTIETNLQQILQASLNLGHFPQIFKETTTVMRKPNKPDYSKSKALHWKAQLAKSLRV